MGDIEEIVKQELELYEAKQLDLEQLTKQLEADPQFKAFIEAQKQFRKIEKEVWGKVEQVMLDNNIKSIKTNKMTLTIAERTSFDIDLEQLQPKFIKRVPDTTKIGGTYKLEGKPPKGCTPKVTKYLVKRIKDDK